LTLQSRIGRLRRRRRVSILKQLVAVIGPVVVVIAFVLTLAEVGAMASQR
jgi:hypothetical protein